MPRFAANVSLMYPQLPLIDRFASAARDGFDGVECLFPYVEPAARIRAALDEAGLEQVLINTPAGDWRRGERGFAALPGRERAFDEALEQAIDYARVLGCAKIHLMAGVPPPDAASDECARVFESNLVRAGARLAPLGLLGLIEPINHRDVPGYFLQTQAQACALIERVGSPAIRLQMDLYHCQITEGDVAMHVRAQIAQIAHVQIAGVPERHEPDLGELHYPYLFALLDTLGYRGWIGCEYHPQGDTSVGLGWLRRWRQEHG